MHTGRFRVTVASPSDGPLRPELEALGAEVHLTAPLPLPGGRAYEARLEELAAWARERGVAAVVANTFGAFAGIHVAGRLGVPSIWAIHESYTLPALWAAYFGNDGSDPALRSVVRSALNEADLLVFEANATRALYAEHVAPERCLLVRYGIEVADLDARSKGLDCRVARRRLRVPEASRVLLCMGTFEPRKAQTVLIRAFEQVADRHPHADLVLVGDRGGSYSEVLHALAENTGLGRRIRFEAVRPDVIPWYIAADILVSASDLESMPRSALEAMGCGTPVLAADVYGLGELVEEGVSGWLVATRDLDALVAGLDRALGTTPAELARIGSQAAERVQRDHDASGYIETYGRLLDDLIAGRSSRPSAFVRT